MWGSVTTLQLPIGYCFESTVVSGRNQYYHRAQSDTHRIVAKTEYSYVSGDYRALNKLTIRNRYPLPNVDQMFEELQGAKVFSAFDAIWGFWQLPLAEEDIPKTAMVTPHGSFEWRALPMGLTNAPAVFMQTMADICRDLKFVKIFIDDLLVFSNTVEEHEEHLQQLMERLAEHKMQLKEWKAKWFQKSVKFLGHVVSANGIKSQQSSKVEAIKQWQPPKKSVL